MNVIIQSYTDQDHALLVEGIQKLQDAVAQMDPRKHLKPSREMNAEQYAQNSLNLIDEGNGAVFIAKDEHGQFRGFIMGTFHQKSANEALESYPSKEGKILELYVEKKGQGIGKALMQRMETYFRENGATGYALECLSTNPAHEFYLKQGYEDRLIVMFKPLK